ncbi:phytoene/squalene synthase family protein [Mangrovibacillus cuniculi]|uniref:Phytoene/squalene synthase family protein n=1 Tax=Mangrovibacillus cuniculi TaxID=2593652 RepID=A0A7S8HEN2_9BACI|nr:phytoene/squalene synthase family protein [Mangrovibacillus cuniculi]QPC46039.1 phytoene/squalene synthase family protein [Mangrovibacillus cuniculi]
MDLQDAYQQCEEIIKHHSKTFYRAFSLLPKAKKQAVWAVYAFCRHVDDIVDEGNHPVKELQVFKEEFNRFLIGEYNSNDPKWVALQDVFSRYKMNTKAFQDMIIGQEMDIQDRVYETVEDVLDYSYHVASTVGLMLLPILAPKSANKLENQAIYLGYAMQLTNILRDVGEDLNRNRVYIPMEILEKHGYTLTQLKKHEVNESFVKVWEEVADLAEDYYEKSLEMMDLYPIHSKTPVKGAALLYRAILSQVRKESYNVFTQKNYVTSEAKDSILASM